MDYQKHYIKLIERSKNSNRKKLKRNSVNFIYYERHHIIPRCMNGNDDLNNIVLLTPEEHYLCHLLLIKIYPSNYSLLHAAKMMCIGEKRNNNKRRKRT